MRVATLLKILAGLVVFIVVLAIVAILVIDPNEYKDEIVAAVEDRTGREFNIESDIDLNLGLTPSFAVGGLRLSNAEWGSRPEMLKVGEFAAEVALVPLIFGNLQINRLVLRDADILIETDATGRSNLDFAGAGKKDRVSKSAAGAPRINGVRIENAILTLRDGAAGTSARLEIRRLTAAAPSLLAPLEIDLDAIATLDGTAVEFDAEGKIGALTQLLAGGQPYPIDLTANGFGLTAKIDGAIADPANTKGLDLKLEVSGADLNGLAALAGEGLPTAGPIALAASVKGDADNAVLENVAFKIGQTDLAGRASVDRRGDRPKLAASLKASQIDFTELFPGDEMASDAGATDQNAAADTAKPKAGDKVFPSEPLPLDVLKSFDAKLDFEVTKLILQGAILADTKGVLALDNGALAIKPLETSLASSEMAGNVSIDTRSEPATVSFELNASKLDIGGNLRAFAGLENVRGSGTADVSLRGAGGSVAEIMASLNGHTRVLMDEGEMRNQFLGNISGLTQTLGEAFGKKEWVAVECIASDFDIVDGIAHSKINVVNTELVLITVEGKVDLAQEKLDLKVTPRPKGIDLSLAVPVRIGGSLARPTFSPDTVGIGKKISGIVGTVVFPPAALIGLANMGGRNHPCLQMSETKSAPQQESETSAPAETGTDTDKGALERAGEGLKKLFGN